MNGLKGAMYLSGASIIWGGMCIVGKYTMNSIPPMTLISMRFVVACLVLWIFVRRKQWRSLNREDHLRVAVIGVIGCTLSIGTQFIGIHMSSAHMSAVLTATSPIFIALLAPSLLKEKLTVKSIISLFIAAIGMAITMVHTEDSGRGDLVGNALLLVAAASWALYSILAKPLNNKHSADIVLFWSVLYGTICLVPFVGVEMAQQGVHFPTTDIEWFGVLYLGVFSTATAFLFWNKGFGLIPSQVAGLFQFVQPVVGSILAWALLGEQLSAAFFFGSLFILLGVSIALTPTPPSTHQNSMVSPSLGMRTWFCTSRSRK